MKEYEFAAPVEYEGRGLPRGVKLLATSCKVSGIKLTPFVSVTKGKLSYDAYLDICEDDKIAAFIRKATERGVLAQPSPRKKGATPQRQALVSTFSGVFKELRDIIRAEVRKRLAEEQEQEQAKAQAQADPSLKDYFDDGEWLYFVPFAAPPIKLCRSIEVLAAARSFGSDYWEVAVRFRDLDGVAKDLRVERQWLTADSRKVASLLSMKGLMVAPEQKARELLNRYLALAEPTKRIRTAARTGWNGNVFVLPDCAIGVAEGEEVVLAIPPDPSPYPPHSGTLAEWRDHVASFARHSTRVGNAISVAFAAPLAEALGMESGMVHHVGGSTIGKSTAGEAAASAYRPPQRAETWLATSNGLEVVAARHSDLPLVLDEIGQCDAREVGKIIYMLSEGLGKQRATVTGAGRARATWRACGLSSGEIDLEGLMAKAGLRPTAGQLGRLLNVPAYGTGKGLGIFDKLPPGYATSKEAIVALRENAKLYYGTAFREFLRQLTGDRGRWEDYARAKKAEFLKAAEKSPTTKDAGTQVWRALSRFACFAAAGETATAMGVTGWDEGDAKKMNWACAKDWLAARGGKGEHEATEIVRLLRAFIDENGSSRFTLLSHYSIPGTGETTDFYAPVEDKTIRRAGYRSVTRDATESTYYIFSDVLMKEICQGFSRRAVLDALVGAGLLTKQNDGKFTIQRRIYGQGVRFRGYPISASALASTGEVEDEPAAQAEGAGV